MYPEDLYGHYFRQDIHIKCIYYLLNKITLDIIDLTASDKYYKASDL